ncbi:hypothetical protein [Neobacillus cucumis]|uniref:hypothetical protein n=1 Tax=Neobacillus cucumis TaxID=1740721 RepID=UPI002E1BC6FE|nr:hypothetical protein [Neobacillus cucumis]
MNSEIYEMNPDEPELGTLPLFNSFKWGICFLVFGIVLSIIFGMTMPEFFKAAYAK